MLQVTGHLEKQGKMFLGWLDNFKGISAQGSTENEVVSKLVLLLRVKISYDYKLPLSSIQAKEDSEVDESFIKQKDNSFQLQL
jgi:hypothetical protein